MFSQQCEQANFLDGNLKFTNSAPGDKILENFWNTFRNFCHFVTEKNLCFKVSYLPTIVILLFLFLDHGSRTIPGPSGTIFKNQFELVSHGTLKEQIPCSFVTTNRNSTYN